MQIRRWMAILFCFIFLWLNETILGETLIIYKEDFNTCNSLTGLGFSGNKPTYWELDTANDYMKSCLPEKKSAPARIYSSGFQANREDGAIITEWKVNFLSGKPGHQAQEHQAMVRQSGDKHQEKKDREHGNPLSGQIMVSLTDGNGNALYSLVFIPQFKDSHRPGYDLTLLKNNRFVLKPIKITQLKSNTPIDSWIKFKMELNPIKKSGGDGLLKVFCDFGDGRGYVKYINTFDETYTQFSKLHFTYETGAGARRTQIAIDDLLVSQNIVKKDNTPPITTQDYNYDGQWINQPVEIHLTSSDDLSGVLHTYYKINDSQAVAENVINLNTDGVYTIQYWAVD